MEGNSIGRGHGCCIISATLVAVSFFVCHGSSGADSPRYQHSFNNPEFWKQIEAVKGPVRAEKKADKDLFTFDPVQQILFGPDAEKEAKENEEFQRQLDSILDEKQAKRIDALLQRSSTILDPTIPVLFSVRGDTHQMGNNSIARFNVIVAATPLDAVQALIRTGIFTAPASGLYLFIFNGRNKHGKYGEVALTKNGAEITKNILVEGAYGPYNIHTFVPLCIGDKVSIKTIIGGFSGGAPFNMFSGHLVSPGAPAPSC